MNSENKTLKEILKTLKTNNLYTGLGAVFGLVALVISLVALLK